MKFAVMSVNEDKETLEILKNNPNFHYDSGWCWWHQYGYIEINTLEELIKLKDEVRERFII